MAAAFRPAERKLGGTPADGKVMTVATILGCGPVLPLSPPPPPQAAIAATATRTNPMRVSLTDMSCIRRRGTTENEKSLADTVASFRNGAWARLC